MADRAPDGMTNLTPGEHLVHAHAHTISAGVHADLAAAHVKAAHDGAPDGAGGDAGEGTDGGSDGRSLPAFTTPPQAGYAQNRTGPPQIGYAQNRTGFSAGSGAARAYRAATRRV